MGLEKLDREDLVECDVRETRGNSKELKKGVCKREVKKFSFHYRSIPV